MSLQAEMLMAHIGVDEILEGKPVLKLSAKDLKAIDNTGETFRKLLKAYLDGAELPPPTYSSVSMFDRISEALNKPMDQKTVEKKIQNIPNELEVEFGIKLMDVLSYLSQRVPSRVDTDLLGSKLRPPSDAEKYDFMRLYNVINTPLNLIYEMGRNSLSKDEVTAVETLFPELLAELKYFTAEALVAYREKHDSLSKNKNKQLSTLLGADIDSGFISELQKSFEAKEGGDGGAAAGAAEAIDTQNTRISNPT